MSLRLRIAPLHTRLSVLDPKRAVGAGQRIEHSPRLLPPHAVPITAGYRICFVGGMPLQTAHAQADGWVCLQRQVISKPAREHKRKGCNLLCSIAKVRGGTESPPPPLAVHQNN